MATDESTTEFTMPDLLAAVDTPSCDTDSDASLSCATYPAIEPYTSVPVPGETYQIKDVETGRTIMMEDGILTLKSDVGKRGGWHWHCVERAGGWLGFREAVSGNYLGRDGKGGFQVKFNHFISWESFCLRPLKGGGYHILVLQVVKDTSCLRRIGIADSYKLIEVETAAEATLWEFIKV
ncbi:hypothetical protein F5B18DRAFT_656703 [Nemania serpens]|nr:hypothetical protein F5B18DRAFT_656703 [Nemania serpens]